MPDNQKIKKILYISEALSAPFDEGIKNVAYSLHKQLGGKADVLSVTNAGNKTDNLKIRKINLNKLFLNSELRKLIKTYSPDVILYLPEASVTLNSFVRARVLKLMRITSKVVMLGVQHREYSLLQSIIIEKFLRPDMLLFLGRSHVDFFKKRGMPAKVLPPAVDNLKFIKSIDDEKNRIRELYDIPINKMVVLHVGHIKANRNIECFIEVQKIDGIQVVIVGSTSIIIESDIKEKLVKSGIRVIDKSIPDISNIYKMSDIYVFPVISNKEAIDMPLSVLEAMATNLPIITTRFGGLVDNFREDTGFKYFSTIEELLEFVKQFKELDKKMIHNDEKMEPFTWNRFSDDVIVACEEII